MTPAEILAGLIPGALKLAVEALSAILKGNPQLAARKAEEAAQRQLAKLTADAAIKAKKAPRK